MTTTQTADIFGFRKITKKGLLESCKKNKLYRTPALNDVLYLHYQGFEDIECLEEYTGLKCIWLECNAITKISGFDNQKLLKCLFLHNNVIKKMENLECCPELDTINLSHNHIIKIENCGIDKLPVLTSLNLSHNYLRTYDSLVNLVECKMISVLDLANNRIEDILCIKIFAQMPELRVLVLQGNPVVNQIPQYRKTLILDCVNLTYLDSRPVFPRDRACAEAWKQGGYEAERIEHARWNREERKKIRQSVNATLRLRNRGGGDPQPQLLMSSDDEDAGITELTSAPSLEKDQMNKAGNSLFESSDDEDPDNNIQSIPLFKVREENKQASSLFNTEERCIICSRVNCKDEHIKKRKRVWNREEPETILENSFIFNLDEESHKEILNNNNDFDIENKLYNEVYHKNIQYINEAVSTNELKNKEEDNLNNTISIPSNNTQPTELKNKEEDNLNNTISIPSNNTQPSNEQDNVETTELFVEKNIINKSLNISQLLVRSHEQDNDITELSLPPPMKRFKSNIENNSTVNTDETFSTCSQAIIIEEPLILKGEGTEAGNILENVSSNSDNMKDNNLINKNILYDNNSNNQYISEIVDGHITPDQHEKTIVVEIDSIEPNDSILSESHIRNIETSGCISEITSKSIIKYEPDVNSNRSDNIEQINNASVESLKNIEKQVTQLIDFGASLNLMNTLPAIFSSKLYLGTDTKINSAIALYEMHHKKDYNSENDSDEFEMSIKTIKQKDEEPITNDKNNESENLVSKMEIINRLLNDPLTKTCNYDSSKINEEIEILKNNDKENNNIRLRTFMENHTEKIEISNHPANIHVSKSEEIILQNNLNNDDEGKNMVETHSSDTRILKIKYI